MVSRETFRTMITAVAGAALALAGNAIIRAPATQAASPPLVYACAQVPCANSQEFTISDVNGAPIFSVGEYGGSGTFGDNASVYAPGSITQPAITESWESPAAYDKALSLPDSCTGARVWLEPRGVWLCHAGEWTRRRW